jgi:hypothetical protein
MRGGARDAVASAPDARRGALVDVPLLVRLTAYEGSGYRRSRVVVQTANGNTVAPTWIVPAGTRRLWKE